MPTAILEVIGAILTKCIFWVPLARPKFVRRGKTGSMTLFSASNFCSVDQLIVSIRTRVQYVVCLCGCRCHHNQNMNRASRTDTNTRTHTHTHKHAYTLKHAHTQKSSVDFCLAGRLLDHIGTQAKIKSLNPTGP